MGKRKIKVDDFELRVIVRALNDKVKTARVPDLLIYSTVRCMCASVSFPHCR